MTALTAGLAVSGVALPLLPLWLGLTLISYREHKAAEGFRKTGLPSAPGVTGNTIKLPKGKALESISGNTYNPSIPIGTNQISITERGLVSETADREDIKIHARAWQCYIFGCL